jgi:voltage-gated potassium channel
VTRPLVRAAASIAAVLVAGGCIYAVVPMRGPLGWIGALGAVAAPLLLVPVTVRRARAIAVSEQPVADAAVAITFLFTMLVLGFASTYVVLADRTHGMVGVETKIDAAYFALVTLSTVGYGDVHAAGQAARVVVSIQIVVDLAFIAVAVRLLTNVALTRTASTAPAGASRSRG